MAAIRFSQRFMARFGAAILELIEESIANGVDAQGQSFKPYSAKPFARPAGGIPQRALTTLKASGGLEFFSRQGRALWIVIKGGYLALKKAINRGAGSQVDLTSSGLMLQSLALVRVDPNSLAIGFTNDEAALRAFYHTVSGAGKSRVIRDFLGLPDTQYASALETALQEAQEGEIDIQGGFAL